MSLSRWQKLSMARIGNAVRAASCAAAVNTGSGADEISASGIEECRVVSVMGILDTQWSMPALLIRSAFF